MRDGAYLKAHVTTVDTEYFDLFGADNALLQKVSIKSVKSLIRHERIELRDQLFYYKSLRRRNIVKNREYSVSFVGHPKRYKVSAPTLGRAKYLLYKAVKEKMKPDLKYDQMRGCLLKK